MRPPRYSQYLGGYFYLIVLYGVYLIAGNFREFFNPFNGDLLSPFIQLIKKWFYFIFFVCSKAV